MKRILATALTLSFAFTAPAFASDDGDNLMKDIKKAAGPVVKMSKGKMAYDSFVAIEAATTLADLAPQVKDHFADTKIKAILQDRAKFNEYADKFVVASKDFLKAAKSEDQATTMAGLKKFNESCKTCHKSFKPKKN